MTRDQHPFRRRPPGKRARGGLAVVAVAAATALCGPSPAPAHSNITMAYRVIFNFENDVVRKISEFWTFDDLFSDEMLTRYDVDHDGKFNERENRRMGDEILDNLSSYGYLTYVTAGGQDIGTLFPEGFRATTHGGVVTFAFVLRLPTPVDPRRTPLTLEIRDPDFAVTAFPAAKNPVMLQGAEGGRCRTRLADDAANASYGGTPVPKVITLTCGR